MTVDLDAVLHKTEKGRAEIESRAHGLSMGVRRVLILVDGRLRVAQILAKVGMSAEVQAALDQLVREGYVATEAGETGPEAGGGGSAASSEKTALVALAQSLLGGQADRVVRKLEETDDTPQALAGAVEACQKLIRLVIDERKSVQFAEQAAAILARARR